MKFSRSNWILMTGMGITLALILALLFFRTQTHNTARYFEDVAVLCQLKQLDARWELDVLKSKMGINSNYDSLVDPLVEMSSLRKRLQMEIESRHQAGETTLTALEVAFLKAVEEKTRLIEHFKSHNSILGNSLAFLPTAASDLESAASSSAGTHGAAKDFSVQVNGVLLESVVFSQAPSEEKAAEVLSSIDRLYARAALAAPSIRDALDIFVAHVRVVLNEQPLVNAILGSIADVPTSAAIDAIDNVLSTEQRETELKTQQYRRYLLVFTAGLASLLLYAAVGLIRSHGVINRVNQQLQIVNTTLEDRVRQRTQELSEAQSELVSTARHAGMAEIANNVLHNVGNVLTSVNVSAGVISDRLRESKARGLAQATQLLREHSTDLPGFLVNDTRGKLLPGYLDKLSAALSDERLEVVKELETMTRSIDHIKEIVATQQAYSGAITVIESVQITDLMEDALRMNAAAITRHQITVVKEFAELPPLLLDKHLVLQILINLIGNAKQAMETTSGRPHQLVLRTQLFGAADRLHLRVCVEDDGEGIPPDNLAQLFTHGFTTRKHGHGFGLHSCALAAKEMKGTIGVKSDGRDKGAAFTLELPVSVAETESPLLAAMVA